MTPLPPGGRNFDYGYEAPQEGKLNEIIGNAAQTSNSVGAALLQIVEACKAKGITAANELSACVQDEVNRLKAAGSETLSRVQMGVETALTGTIASAGERIAALQRAAGIPSTTDFPATTAGGRAGTTADIDIAGQKRQGMQGQGQGQGQRGQGQGKGQGPNKGPPQGGQQVIIQQGGPVIIQQQGPVQGPEGFLAEFPGGLPGGVLPGFPAGGAGPFVAPLPPPGTPGGPGTTTPFPGQPGSPAAPGSPGMSPGVPPYPGTPGVPGLGVGPTQQGPDSPLLQGLLDLLAHQGQAVPPQAGAVADKGILPFPVPGPGVLPGVQPPNVQQVNQMLQQVQQILTVIQSSPKQGDSYVVNAQSVSDLSSVLENVNNTVNNYQTTPPVQPGSGEVGIVDAIRAVAQAVAGGTYDQWFDVARGKLADDRPKIVQYFGESFAGIYEANTREESILAMSDIVFPDTIDPQLDEYFPDGIS